MQKSQLRRSIFKVSSWHLLVLVYCLVIGALIAMISSEKKRISKPVSITNATSEVSQDLTTTLSFHGEGLHGKLRILHAADMVDDRALQWETLPGISLRAIAVKDRIALVGGMKNKLVSVDLTTPGEPMLLDSLELPGNIREIVIVGNRALVGMARGGGFAIIDIDNPDDLQMLNTFPSAGSVADMVAAGDQVYFADLHRGFGRISLIRETSAPEILDTLNQPWRLALSGDRLVVACLDGRMVFYDLSRGDKINRVGTYIFPGLKKGGIRGVAFSEESLAVALSDGSMRMFPLSAWPRLEEYSSVPLPGVPYRVMSLPGRNRMAVSLVSAGVALVELKPSGSAVVSGHLMLPTTNIAMDVEDDMIYASWQGGRQGMVAIGIDGIEQSSFYPATYVDRSYHAFHAWNGRLFGYRRDKVLVALADEGHCGTSSSGPILLVNDDDGVSMFRMSESVEVIMSGSIVAEDGALEAVYAEGYLYVLHRGGLRILSDPQVGEMAVVGDLELSGQPVHLKSLEPGYLLVSTREEGIKVVDVSDRKHPVQVAAVSPPEHLRSTTIAHDVFINGRFAYVSQGSGGLYVIDLDDPGAPELLQIVDTPGFAGKMVLHDDLLLVADGDAGVYMIDASSPGRLLPVGSLPTPLRINEIATVADGILISNYPGGTMKLPFPERLKKFLVVSGELLQSETSASGGGKYVYLYDEHSRNRVLLEPSVD